MLKKTFSLAPSGTLVYGDSKKTIQSFFIQKTEVTNAQYRKFLNELFAEGNQEEYLEAQIDSSGWLEYSETLAREYHTNPYYDNYPVVNISRTAAELYCKWLTGKLNQGKKNVVPVRLPTEEEWMYAAMGGKENVITPWGYPGFCNTKYQFLLNFLVDSLAVKNCGSVRLPYVDQNNIRTVFTEPVDSYYPNGYGLYNICGNVAEMIQEPGRTKGGSWNAPAEYIWIITEKDPFKGITKPSPGIGFRPVMTYAGM